MDGIGGNQRRRASWEEDDQITNNQRRRTNPALLMVTNEPPQNDGVQSQVWEDDRVVVAMNEPPRNDVVVVQTGSDDDNDDSRLLPLSLSLRQPTPYSSSQIASPSPLRLAPPSPVAPMQTWSPRYLMARFPPSYQPYFATTSPPPSYLLPSSFSYSPYQTLSRGPSAPIHPPPPPYAPPFDFLAPAVRPVSSSALVVESRRSYRSQSNRNRKDDDTIPPPYPWATSKRGAIQSLENLHSKQITTITGNVQCKHCEKVYQMSYNLREKFSEVVSVFASLKRLMRERAPAFWTNPEPMRCELCGRDKAVKPVIAQRKRQINWLFLLLGQVLGYCTLEQLKNFCKHSKSHRTGAKDRVLYLTYLGLCKMLEPDSELFNRGGR